MQQILLDEGVPERNILREEASENTAENAVYVRTLLEDTPVQEVSFPSTQHDKGSPLCNRL